MTCSGLVRRLSYGVDEYVDHLTPGLRADAIEYRVQASGGVRVGVTDDGLGRGGDGQLDASPVLRVRGATRHTSPAWASRSTIAEVAGGLVPRVRARSVRVTGASALIRCSTVSWASVSPRPAQTTVLAATRPRRWVTSQRTSCAVTLFAGWPPVARWLLDRACGWPPGRTPQIQPPMYPPTNAGRFRSFITIA